jgi:hypothetical protein
MKPRSFAASHSFKQRLASYWWRLVFVGAGLLALAWFIVRVVPKPSRATYPCQRAAFPLASSFVIWVMTLVAAHFAFSKLRRRATAIAVVAVVVSGLLWMGVSSLPSIAAEGDPAKPYVPGSKFPSKFPQQGKYDWTPGPANQPLGVARGIHPGRVVWTRDPAATKWAGRWKLKEDQWWLDENTDLPRVSAMLSKALQQLTSTTADSAAWDALLRSYNQRARGLARGYEPGETIAVKVNLNNSEGAIEEDNKIDTAPQTVLAMVRQLVNQAHIPQEAIIVYDARRFINPAILTKVWSEFKDVRFVQFKSAAAAQPVNPAYGDHRGLEGSDWVEAMTFSGGGPYKDAKMIPKQVRDATYLINLALLKLHSYPYNTMEDGDEGQTAVTMTGKNHFGSVKGTPEFHSDIDTAQKAKHGAYSPMVDLAASPTLGGKTILYMLDGLYCGRKWKSFPLHFPNPPFNNRVEPYENPDWPASYLLSQDGVALDSVGLDILYSQTKNNGDPINDNLPRILVRENADDYLVEMADPQHAPSKTNYIQGGKAVESLGVHEHWDSDATRRYSRNLDPVNGKGIELIYVSVGETKTATVPNAPAVLPGKGLAQHDFFYAGEAKTERMLIVRGGKIVWSYTHPAKGEISDAVLLPSGNILFAHQDGVTEITADKQVIWNHDAPPNTEIHTAQPIGLERVAFVQNGDPAKFIVINKVTGVIEREFVLPVKNPQKVHGHFRQARLLENGNVLVAHMDLGRVCEYDLNGNPVWSMDNPGGLWSATPLKSGNILLTGGKAVREVNRKKEIVWEWTQADTPDYQMSNVQVSTRLPNGNTIINNWFNEWSGKIDPANPPLQAIEVTPEKKVVWALRSWEAPADLGPSTILQILD